MPFYLVGTSFVKKSCAKYLVICFKRRSDWLNLIEFSYMFLPFQQARMFQHDFVLGKNFLFSSSRCSHIIIFSMFFLMFDFEKQVFWY